MSHRLFELTNTLKNVAVPHSNDRQLLRNALILISTGAVMYVTMAGVMHMFVYRIL